MILENYIQKQKDWSYKTFGPDQRTKGVLNHIRKELDEVEKDPTDIYEWVDIMILALDGAWRAGHSPEDIAKALEAKQAKNLNREWPDWRGKSEDEPIEHVR